MKESKTIVFMVTNGAGLGHLTRGLAVARRLKKLSPELNIVFLTTSLATEVIREAGFMFYYMPTKAVMPDNVTAGDWNRYISRQLSEIIEIHHPIAFVYDGAYPYAGVLSSISKGMIKSIWIKRECYKEKTQDLSKIENIFDLVIVPKEIDSVGVVNTAKKKYCEPIIFLDKEEAHERERIRSTLGVAEHERLFYLQLGAGIINSTDTIQKNIINILLKNPSHKILLGESIIGKHIDIKNPKIFTIRSYPNSQYFKALDGAVSAAGYNTFHELLFFGVPTIFIPNMKTSMDDQLARIKKAENKKACICLKEEQSNQEYINAVDHLIIFKEAIRKKAEGMIKENGAMQAARYINEFIEEAQR